MNRRRFVQTSAALLTAVAAEAHAFGQTSRRDISLDGEWLLNTARLLPSPPPLSESSSWRTIRVPGCWEAQGTNAQFVGPAWYARRIQLPASAADARWWLECDAVSYDCDAWAATTHIGAHRGMWDAFAFEIPAALARRGELEISLRVEKPGARVPVREALAGFLPDVWGTWGGPWQSVRLHQTGPARFASVRAQSAVDSSRRGRVKVIAVLDVPASAPATVGAVLRDSTGRVLASQTAPAQNAVASISLDAGEINRWHMVRRAGDSPALYLLDTTVDVNGIQSDIDRRRIGFRSVEVDGTRILLNGEPIYPRGALSWGWYPRTRAPNPSPAEIRHELESIRALGFNLMKLCLWVPPSEYFDIADEMGMLLWQELPLWAANATPDLLKRTPTEYARIVDQRADHPSVIVWTCGCEMSKAEPEPFLAQLYEQVKRQTSAVLVRDNSGSSETYDGPLPEHADFWDFHFYTNLPFFRPLVESFAPRWRKPQPWLFGEFCDYDTYRDLELVIQRNGGVPWWASPDAGVNPMGVRPRLDLFDQEMRLRNAGLLDRRQELREVGRRQGELVRKITLEATRAFPFISGYVVTGLTDTPITTAGLLDYFGQPRFSASFRQFNHDTVLFAEPYRARLWVHGGDRARYRPRWTAWSGDAIHLQLGISHFGSYNGTVNVAWSLAGVENANAQPAHGMSGTLPVLQLTPGSTQSLGWICLDAPRVSRPQRFVLNVSLTRADGVALSTNAWPLFVFPQLPWADDPLPLFDPAGIWADAESLARTAINHVDNPAQVLDNDVVFATEWDERWRAWLNRGGRLLLAQGLERALPATNKPFWREGLHLFNPHPAWGEFPIGTEPGIGGWTDLQFYGLATDVAILWPEASKEIEKAAGAAAASIQPLFRRVDSRTYEVACYALAGTVGKGRLIATSLRLQGGNGDQPQGVEPEVFENIAATYLMRQWLRVLSA